MSGLDMGLCELQSPLVGAEEEDTWEDDAIPGVAELHLDRQREIESSEQSRYIKYIQRAAWLAGIPRALGWPKSVWGKAVLWTLLTVNALSAMHAVGFTFFWLLSSGYFDLLLYTAHILMCVQPLMCIGVLLRMLSRKSNKLVPALCALDGLGLVLNRRALSRSVVKSAAISIVVVVPFFIQFMSQQVYALQQQWYQKMLRVEPLVSITRVTNVLLPFHFCVVPAAAQFIMLTVLCILWEHWAGFRREVTQNRDFIRKAAFVHRRLVCATWSLVGHWAAFNLVGVAAPMMILLSLAVSVLSGQISFQNPPPDMIIRDFWLFIMTGVTYTVMWFVGLFSVAWLSSIVSSVHKYVAVVFANISVSRTSSGEALSGWITADGLTEAETDELRLATQRLLVYLRESFGYYGVDIEGISINMSTVLRLASIVASVIVATVQKMVR